MSWEYIAGFFDGEGSVSFNKRSRQYFLTFVQKDENVLQVIKAFLAENNIKAWYGEHTRTTAYQKNRTRYFDLRIVCHKCLIRLLTKITPHLIVKRNKCCEAIAFTNGKKWLNNKKHCNEDFSN